MIKFRPFRQLLVGKRCWSGVLWRGLRAYEAVAGDRLEVGTEVQVGQEVNGKRKREL